MVILINANKLMAISKDELEKLVSQSFPGSKIQIKDLVGDGDHYELMISSDAFEGQSKVSQHRMVNQALKECLGGRLHALSIKTQYKTEAI